MDPLVTAARKHAYRELLDNLKDDLPYEYDHDNPSLNLEDELRFDLYALKQLIMDDTDVPDDFKQEITDRIEDELTQLNTPLSYGFEQHIIREIKSNLRSLEFDEDSIDFYVTVIKTDHWLSNPCYRPRRFGKHLYELADRIQHKQITYQFF